MSTKSRILIAGGTVLLLSLIGLLFTGSALSVGPFSKGVRWRAPTMMSANTNGTMAVMNEAGRTLVILDGSGRVTGVVESGVGENQFRRPLGLAVADDAVYVADARDTGNGNAISGVRIVRYGFDGVYAGAAYEEKFDEARSRDQGLNGLTCRGNRLFGFGVSDGKGCFFEFVDGERKLLGAAARLEERIHAFHFLPRVDTVIVSLDNGKTLMMRSANGRVEEDAALADLQCIECSEDGTEYWSCRTKPGIWSRRGSEAPKKIADVRAGVLLPMGGKVFFADRRQLNLRVCDLKTGAVADVVRSPYASRVLLTSGIAWLCLIVMTLVTIAALTALVVRTVRRARRRNDAAESAAADAPMGMAELYGEILVLALVIFVVVTSTLSVGYYQDLVKSGRDSALKTASLLRDLAPENIGDALAKMTPGTGEAAGRVVRFVNSVCSQGRDQGTDLDCDVLRFEPDGGIRCLLTLGRCPYVPGDLLEGLPAEGLRRAEVEPRAREGKLTELSIGGYKMYAVPLMDGKGELSAVAYLRLDERNVLASLESRIVNLSIDLLSQLLVLVMIFGECRLLKKFVQLRKERRAAGVPVRTMCESQRPIRILQYVIAALFIAFLPDLSGKSAEACGLSGELMTTLPLVALSVGFYAGRMLLQDVCSRSPRITLYVGSTGMLGFAALMALFIFGGQNYWVLVAAMFVQALACAIMDCACMSLRGCGIDPDRKFSLLVFTNMEPAIGSGVGVALGAFLYDKLGLGWVTGAGVLLAVGVVALGAIFVRRDIDASALAAAAADSPAAPAARASLWATVKFCLSPVILAIVICVTMPVGIISSFESYALPVFNEESGNSVVLVGFVLVVAKFLTLFALPSVIRQTDKAGNVLGMTIAFAAVLGAVLLFAFSPTLVLMVAIVLVFGLSDSVVATCAERQEVAEAERCGISYDAAAKFLVIGEAIAYSAGAPIFCAIMAGGYSCLGFSVFFAGLALLGIFLFTVWRAKGK